jgi:hypothetical protein
VGAVGVQRLRPPAIACTQRVWLCLSLVDRAQGGDRWATTTSWHLGPPEHRGVQPHLSKGSPAGRPPRKPALVEQIL